MDSEEGRELMAEADGRVHEDNTEERVKVGQDARFNLLVVFLALSMLTAGTVQTVSLKFQDKTIVDESTRSHFSHPAVQSAEMFVGELLCLLPHFALRLCAKNANQSFAKQTGASPDSADPEAALEQYFKHRSLRAKIYGLVGFAIPAACDACATTLLNVGLLLTFASVYQMLRGSLVLFTGLLAATVLRKRLHAHHWIGMGLILVGAIIIGVVSVIQEGSSPSSSSSSSSPSPSPPAATTPGALHIGSSLKSSGVSLFSSESAKRILGDVLIVLAQLLMATQFVVEEKLMTRFKTPPLLAVGLEGFWGLCMFGITLPLLALLKQSNGQPVESLSLAISQIADNRGLFISTLTAILAISFFNAFGLAITRCVGFNFPNSPHLVLHFLVCFDNAVALLDWTQRYGGTADADIWQLELEPQLMHCAPSLCTVSVLHLGGNTSIG